MKPFNKISYLIILMSSLMILGCTHDTEYIAGPSGDDGINGIDGVDGLDGADGSAEVCIACHSNSKRDPIHAAYENSNHFNFTVTYTGASLPEYANRTSCARCHTGQGFQEYIETGIVSEPFAVPSTITCTTCHDNHRSFDFETDGQDYALRTIDPIHLIVDSNYTIDMTNESNPLGTSNTCINCHQPRTPSPQIASTIDGKFMITSTHWGPHHGPQATMLEGIQGAEIAGSAGYPAAGSSTHRSSSSCVGCHMGEPTAADNGSHSFFPTRGACVQCHDDSGFPTATSYDYNGVQTATLSSLEELAVFLATVPGQDIAKDSNGDYQPVFEADGVTPVMHVGIVVDGHPVRGLYDYIDAQAAFNYLLVEEDKSEGVHNPAYVEALLANSIEAFD